MREGDPEAEQPESTIPAEERDLPPFHPMEDLRRAWRIWKEIREEDKRQASQPPINNPAP